MIQVFQAASNECMLNTAPTCSFIWDVESVVVCEASKTLENARSVYLKRGKEWERFIW